LLRTYVGLTLPKLELGVSDFARIFDQFGDHSVMGGREKYFREVFRNSAPIPRFDRSRRGNRPNLSGVEANRSSSIVRALSAEDRDLLHERARMSGSTIGTLLMAAMGQTLARRGNVDEINITLPLAMREDMRLSNFVGWVAGNAVVRCRVASIPLLERLAQDMSDQVRNALAYMPADFTLQHGRLHDELSHRGSYLGLYESGDASARSSQPSDSGKVLNFGSSSIEPIVSGGSLRETFREFDLRTFNESGHPAIRCGYDEDVFEAAQAAEIFDEILDRLDLLNEKRQSDVLQSS
jgi:hypothetical protein